MSKYPAGDLFGDTNDSGDELFENGSEKDNEEESSNVDSASAEMGLAQYEERSTEERFRNLGYLEAFEEAKDSKLQNGFEEGYTQTFSSAVLIGEALGETATRLRLASRKNDVSPISTIKETDSMALKETAALTAKLVYEFLLRDGGNDKISGDTSSSELQNLAELLKEQSESGKN